MSKYLKQNDERGQIYSYRDLLHSTKSHSNILFFTFKLPRKDYTIRTNFSAHNVCVSYERMKGVKIYFSKIIIIRFVIRTFRTFYKLDNIFKLPHHLRRRNCITIEGLHDVRAIVDLLAWQLFSGSDDDIIQRLDHQSSTWMFLLLIPKFVFHELECWSKYINKLL